jgi:tRNA-modifying protein YgfZ
LYDGTGLRKSHGRGKSKESYRMANTVAPLDDRAIIELTGDGTLGFLQDLITTDVVKLQPGGAAHGGLLTPQGKILFDFFVVAIADGVLVECPAEARAALLQRLTMYKLRRAIDIAARDDLAVAVAWGDEAPSVPQGVISYHDPRLAELGWRLIGPVAAITEMAEGTADAHAAHRHALGIADSVEIGSGEMFPHEANYDQLGSVNFAKGCYVGQEVVSRMQHRGTARSRIVPVSAAEALPARGSVVMAGERKVGSLVGQSGRQGIALVRLDRAATAAANGTGLSVDGVAITMHKPHWARWPEPQTAIESDD